MPRYFKPSGGSGDKGFTDLLGGRRVPKTDRRIKLNALLDELSAMIGMLKVSLRDRALKKELTSAQAGLVRTSAVIAGMKADLSGEISALEALIEARSERTRPPKEFVMPGANEAEALAHLARTRARCCEILAWELKAKDPAVYLNRLSDYLFLAALSAGR
ncbi:MAG: ATP:cob(I)alamin adenosyltransferase [Elusimicrobia bacterium]|nr:ATP:cob(I)alamin adenosyltransferase [Elusimicrobiota bacterium]